LLTNERQSQASTNEYPVRVLLVGSKRSGREELFKCLSVYQTTHKLMSRDVDLVVSGSFDDKVIRAELLSAGEREMSRADWHSQQASAAVFVYDPSRVESVTFLRRYIDSVIRAMNEEVEKIRGYYTDAVNLKLGEYDPGKTLTVADFKRISVPVPFVPHVLVLSFCPEYHELSSQAQAQAQELSASVRDLAFEKGLRWTSVNHPLDDSVVRTLLCVARGVVEDCDLIGTEEWNQLVQGNENHGGRCVVM